MTDFGSRDVAGQFTRFAVVGTLGFAVDTATLYAVVGAFSLNLYAARVVSFLVAASTTWFLNRTWTFRLSVEQPAHRQWLAFLSVNSLGGFVNYLVYALLIGTVAFTRRWPVIAIGVGSLSGLSLNFLLSRAFVFQQTKAGS
jgi:putative flippase GtrA